MRIDEIEGKGVEKKDIKEKVEEIEEEDVEERVRTVLRKTKSLILDDEEVRTYCVTDMILYVSFLLSSALSSAHCKKT